MPLPVGFRLLAHKNKGLKDAPKFLINNLRGTLEGLGKRLRSSAQSRMRKDTGRERDSLKIEVRGTGKSIGVTVYSTLVQAFVDAYGRPAGKFPPFRKGSRLYKWAERRYKGYRSLRVAKKADRVASSLTRKPKGAKRIKRIKKGGPVVAMSRKNARERSIEKMAFLAARHIFERGIRPTHWNRKALEANKSRIIRDLKDALKRTVNQINRG